MKIKDYIRIWDDYYIHALKEKEYVPQNPALKKWFDSYSGTGNNQRDELHMPEPYLGNFETAKIVMINNNPGPVVEEFQNWDTGEAPRDLRNKVLEGEDHPYSEWAKDFIYFSRQDKGTKFWKPRLKFASNVLDQTLKPQDILGLELYPWHSNQFAANKFGNDVEIFNEYFLELIFDAQIKSVFLLRKASLDIAIKKGIDFKKLDENFAVRGLKVYLSKISGTIFVAIINGRTGFTSNPHDLQLIKESIKLM